MKYLVIGPGAMGFYAILGSAYSLYVNQKLDSLISISGSSAGSLVAFGILVSRWDIDRLMNAINKVDVNLLMKFNLKSLLNNYGLVPISRWSEMLSSLCMELAGVKDFTFKELYEWSGTELYISSYNLNLQKSFYFSHNTHPDMSVTTAVCMSMSIPFLFESILYEGHRYIDLAAFESSPLTPFIGKDKNEIISIELDPQPTDRTSKINSLVDFIQHFATSIIRNRTVYEKRTIYIDLKEGEAFKFGMSEEEKISLFKHGFSKASEYITKTE